MAIEIQYEDDVLGFLSTVKGSNGRMNSSSRSDSRGYYNSRDVKQTYSFSYDHTASAAGQYSFYFKNTSSTKEFVLSHIGINSDLGGKIKLWRVSGTAGDGVTITPPNSNLSQSQTADATVLHDGGGTAISGLTQVSCLDYLLVGIDGHEEFRTDDRVRLSQNEAIALEVDAVTSGTPHVFGAVFGYFE